MMKQKGDLYIYVEMFSTLSRVKLLSWMLSS